MKKWLYPFFAFAFGGMIAFAAHAEDGSGACVDPVSAAYSYLYWVDLPGPFSKCDQECKAASSACKLIVTEQADCLNDEANAWQKIQNLYCTGTYTNGDRKDCKSDVKSAVKSWKDWIKQERSDGKGVCNDFQSECDSFCS